MVWRRLVLDKDEVDAAPGWTVEDVLLFASLSARWHNADAIVTAVTAAVEVSFLPSRMSLHNQILPTCVQREVCCEPRTVKQMLKNAVALSK